MRKREVVDEAILDLAIEGKLARELPPRPETPLERVVRELKFANNRLAESVAKIKTVPPQPPTCIDCGKLRRPFAPNRLCDECIKR